MRDRRRRQLALPERTYRRWYDGRSLEDLCHCGHDVGSHASTTSTCSVCSCGVFRPAPVTRYWPDLEERDW